MKVICYEGEPVMVISQTAEYALRAMTCLAAKESEPQASAVIAKETRIPRDYLSKIMRGLVRSKLVNSQRGLHGGFILARPPHLISIHDVIQSVDPSSSLNRCPIGAHKRRRCPLHGVDTGQLCPLHRLLKSTFDRVDDVFRKSSLADLKAQ
jgi:Rrf2 family transcriptional regulator, nitric oxide-sensitive transcriptional repressor